MDADRVQTARSLVVRAQPIWSKGPKTIRVCAGIGDNIWLFQKLVNSGERFNFVLAGDEPRRGKQIFELIPSLAFSAEYCDLFGSQFACMTNVEDRLKTWKEISAAPPDFYLSANRTMEEGRRIETFLPDLPTSFRIDWLTPAFAREEAVEILTDDVKWIGLYGSCYSIVRSWNFWKADEWLRLVDLLLKKFDSPVGFVVIGAAFDSDLAGRLIAKLSRRGIRFAVITARPLEVVIEAMKRLSYFFSFPSGLGILAPTLGCPTYMFYPPFIGKMVNAWADPKAIEDLSYHGSLFCSPEETAAWTLDQYKLPQKL
jgi:hypothetical protein